MKLSFHPIYVGVIVSYAFVQTMREELCGRIFGDTLMRSNDVVRKPVLNLTAMNRVLVYMHL